jgi:hypothetical protein
VTPLERTPTRLRLLVEPLVYGCDGVPTWFHMVQTLELEDNALWVTAQLQAVEPPPPGLAGALLQELPSAFINPLLDRLVTYTGVSPFQEESVESIAVGYSLKNQSWTPGPFMAAEHWAALVRLLHLPAARCFGLLLLVPDQTHPCSFSVVAAVCRMVQVFPCLEAEGYARERIKKFKGLWGLGIYHPQSTDFAAGFRFVLPTRLVYRAPERPCAALFGSRFSPTWSASLTQRPSACSVQRRNQIPQSQDA